MSRNVLNLHNSPRIVMKIVNTLTPPQEMGRIHSKNSKIIFCQISQT